MICQQCPRRCNVDRKTALGACGVRDEIKISRISRHYGEEPCISGSEGSGTVFFSGCSLKCVFCQNKAISRDCLGTEVSDDRLCELLLRLARSGVHNVNLVTPTHYTERLAHILKAVKPHLGVPVVWNSGGYESPDVLRLVADCVDVYLPDFKYASPELSAKYSAVPDYAARASEAIKYMFDVLGEFRTDKSGIAERGVLIRHLVLPGCRHDSINVMRTIADILPTDKIKISLMSQYTPEFYRGDERALRRKVTSFEYNSVLAEAQRLGLDGYMQAPSSATSELTPSFTDELTFET